MKKFIYKSDGNVRKITWVSEPIKHAEFRIVADKANTDRDYSIDTERKVGEMRQFIKQNRLNLSAEAALSITHAVNLNKIIKNFRKIQTHIDVILREYEAGADILAIAKKYDYTPLTILYQILDRKLGRTINVKQAFKGSVNLLTGRDLKQFDRAERVDATGILAQQITSEVSIKCEKIFVAYFAELGIRLKTEDMLKAEQIAEVGHAYSTPDLLFVDEVYINDVRVHWIDFKNYAGTSINVLYSKNKEQAAKYITEWGPGAICYRHSFVDDVKIDNTLLLDCGAISNLKFN